jgi:hypothetical protein
VGLGTILSLQGCGGGTSEASTNGASINDAYYASLAANNYLSHLAAQPPVDPFASVKHFDLSQDTNSPQPASMKAESSAVAYAVYRPAHVLAAQANRQTKATARVPQLLASDSATDEIPSFKSASTIPAACAGLADEALKTCIEDAALAGTAPSDPHISHFDAGALKALLGNGFDSALVAKAIDSKLAHINSADRQRALVRLADYINDAEAHQNFDLATHNVFERTGFVLDGVTFTDASRGDIDGDGDLDNHSTMIIQISKKLNYVRSGHGVLDAALRKVHEQLPVETYMVKLQIFVHLKDLSGLRQTVAAPAANFATAQEEVAYLDKKAAANWINHALDANILRRIVESPNSIPWASTEYVLSFQVSPDNITQHLAPAMTAALAAGDQATAEVIHQHINAQSVIMTGTASAEPAKMFYQVTQPRFGLTGSSWKASSAEHGMFDAAGNRVAIMDPRSGGLVLVGENPTPLQTSTAPVPNQFTKPGACQGNTSNWAYWPSQARTSRFGRGIQWILTEWIFHNQVGDYKNIHWYQSAWKSTAQVAIKGGMKAVEYYLNGEVTIPVGEGSATVADALGVVVPNIGRVLSADGKGERGKSFSIAGYSFSVPDGVITLTKKTAEAAKDQTFKQKLAEKIKSAVKGFLIGRFTDGIGQSLDVTVTGWQDYSDASHYGCFEFSY